jgi:hypothetical protein
VDDVNIYIDELIVNGEGRDGMSSAAERVLHMIPGPQAQQVAASVDRAIATAVGSATWPGTATGPGTT